MKIGIHVECAICRRWKKPLGRSAPLGANYCYYDDCEGYRQDPQAGSLFPGETEEDFGYQVGVNGTKEV